MSLGPVEAAAAQLADNLDQMKEPPCLRHVLTIVSYGIMEINTTPFDESRERQTVEKKEVNVRAVNWNWICR